MQNNPLPADNQVEIQNFFERQKTRTALSIAVLAAVAIGLIIGANFYTANTLKLDPLIEKALMRSRVIGLAIMGPILILLSLKWTRPLLEVERRITAGEDVSNEEALRTMRLGIAYPYKMALAVTLCFYAASVLVSTLLHFTHGLEIWKTVALIVNGLTIGLALGLTIYFGAKLFMRESMEKTIGLLFSKNIFDLTAFRFSLTSKILVVFFSVVSFLLISSFLMALSRLVEERAINRETNLVTAINLRQNPDYMSGLEWYAGSLEVGPEGHAVGGNGLTLPQDVIDQITAAKSDGAMYLKNSGLVIAYVYDAASDLYKVDAARVEGFGEVLGGIKKVMIIIVIMTLALCVVATYFVVSDIRRPIRATVDYLKALSVDLNSSAMPSESDDELGVMAAEIARTTTALKERTLRNAEVVEAVRSAVSRLEKAMAEVVAASEEQAAGISEQVSATEEAISASTEMLATTKAIATDASQVEKAAHDNLNASEHGQEFLANSLRGMSKITQYIGRVTETVTNAEAHFSKVTKIVSIIEKIATQIELLSLNAQIEAASSGESGKRFNVVAMEMSRLSTNTLSSVKEIQKYVESASLYLMSIIREAARGSDIAKEASALSEEMGSTLNIISSAAKSTVDIAQGIAMTTRQQTSASEQMTDTVREVYDSASLIKENAERVRASMEDLKRLSLELDLLLKSN